MKNSQEVKKITPFFLLQKLHKAILVMMKIMTILTGIFLFLSKSNWAEELCDLLPCVVAKLATDRR